MTKKTKKERAQSRLLKHAKNFCDADNKVQEARMWWRRLNDNHDPRDGICLNKFSQRSKCCKYCIDFLNNSPDYQYAMHKRRAAKSNMKRAYKEFLDTRS